MTLQNLIDWIYTRKGGKGKQRAARTAYNAKNYNKKKEENFAI